MKIIIAGAGLTGLTYALLLKRKGYDVELYEKRPIEDIKKLDSIIYVTDKTLNIIKPFIENDIFNKDHPKSFTQKLNTEILTFDDHACIHLADLLQALLAAAAREHRNIARLFCQTVLCRQNGACGESASCHGFTIFNL